jgi:hypothetical protein
MVAIGDTVVFHDPRGIAHRALVTAVHGQTTKEARDARYDEDAEKMRKDAAEHGHDVPHWATEESIAAHKAAPFVIPSINLVYVVGEEDKTDSYGRQIDRATSVPHKSSQTAHGYYYL